MAYEIPGFSWTLPAGQDFRTGAGQFRFVDVSATGKAVVPTGAGARVIGVRQMRPNTNEATTIVSSGISIVEAGGAITAGANVTTDASGRVVAATTGNQIHGVALETASGTGIQIAVLLQTSAAASA